MPHRAFHELEFKLDAPSDDVLRQAQTWVENTNGIFTRRKSRAPAIMQNLFQRSREVTDERLRLYYDTIDLRAAGQGIEIRQEAREKGGVKQMIKIGGNAAAGDSIMDRMEYPCHLDEFGVSFDEIEDARVRRRLNKLFEGCAFKPLVAMVSQRTRLKYHPEGNPNVLIEIAFDYPCWGFALNQFSWQAPEMELEIVHGPDDHASARKLLEREAARFEDKFEGLRRTATSKPTPGFDDLRPWLATDEGRRAFKALRKDHDWWMTPVVRTDFAARNSSVAQRAVAG